MELDVIEICYLRDLLTAGMMGIDTISIFLSFPSFCSEDLCMKGFYDSEFCNLGAGIYTDESDNAGRFRKFGWNTGRFDYPPLDNWSTL